MTHTTGNFYKSMLRLALPIALQILLASSMHLIDTAMIVGLGNVETAAVGVAGRWAFLIHMCYFGLASGSASFISQYWGARDLPSIHATFGFTMVNALAPALLYMALALSAPRALIAVFTQEAPVVDAAASYLRVAALGVLATAYVTVAGSTLRAAEQVWVPFATSAVSVVLNTVLNYGFIYGRLGLPALGITGAAVATVIALWVNATLLTVISLRRRSIICAPVREYFSRWDRVFVRRFYGIVMPVVGNEILWGLGTNVYVMVLARQGAENYAAFTIFSSVEQLAFVFFVGVCHASAIMVGKAIGSGDVRRGWDLSRRFIALVPALSVVCGLALVLSRHAIAGLLPIETEYTRQMTATLLLIYGFWMVMRMIPYITIVGIFRAGGDTRTGFFYDIANVFLLGIPVTWLLGMVLHVPFQYVFLGMYIAEDTLKVILCLRYYRSRRWIRQLTAVPEPDRLPE